MNIEEFKIVLTRDNAAHAAREIVEYLVKYAGNKQEVEIDYDFHINPQTMQMIVDPSSYETSDDEHHDKEADVNDYKDNYKNTDIEEDIPEEENTIDDSFDEPKDVNQIKFNTPVEQWVPNTNVQFDTASGTFLRELILFLTNNDDIDQEGYELMINFLVIVRELLNTKWTDQLRDILREKVLKQKKDVSPLSKLVAINVEIDRLPDPTQNEGSPWLVSVSKLGAIGMAPTAVGQEILKIMAKTGKRADEIVAEKKASGDPNFAEVTGVKITKSVFEVRVDFFADYSMTKPDKTHAQQTQTSSDI